MTAPDLARLAAEAGLGRAQIHVRSLAPDGPAWAADDGRWLYPASLIKLPLAVAVGAAVAGGRLGWDAPAVVEAANLTANDAPSPLVAGYRSTVRELVGLMLQRSDNVATNVLYDLLGRERATADVHALGYAATFFRRKLSGALPLIDDPAAAGRNSHPAREAAAVLAALAADRLPEAAVLRAILADSWWDVKLSRGLEPGDRFAHKTGDTDEVAHDAGILSLAGAGHWVLAVYTELPSSDANDLRFGAFMRRLRPVLAAADGCIARGGAPRAQTRPPT